MEGKILEKGTKAPVLGASLLLSRPAEPTGTPAVPATPEATGTPSPMTERDQPSTTPSPSPIPTASPMPDQFAGEVDTQGRFHFFLPPGKYFLTVVAQGFQKSGPTSLWLAKAQMRDIYLERDQFSLPEVVVTGSREKKAQVSHEVLTQEELKSVPGTGGDVFRALQSLPGVAVAGDLSGQLLVRGGGPQDNLYLVDRIPLAFPFHFGGVISTVNSDLIKILDFSAGGFGPQYGNSWGGVVDITQRDARRDRWGGRVEVNMLLSEGLVEGPITADSSLALSGRRSYLEIFGGLFAGSILTAIPAFGDYQGKYSWDPSRQTHFDLQAFGSDDQLGLTISPNSDLAKQDPAYAGVFDFHNGFNSQGLNFKQQIDADDLLWATLYHTVFFFDTHLGQDLHLDINYEDWGGRFSWTRDLQDGSKLDLGMEVDHTLTGNDSYFVDIPGEGQPNFDLTTAHKISANETTVADNLGIYCEQKFIGFEGSMEAAVGLRADYLDYNGHFTWGPRLSAAYHLSPDSTLKGSYGYYYQLPYQGPYLDKDFGNADLLSEQAVAAVLGLEQKLGEGWSARLEAYTKELTNVVVSDPVLHYSNLGTGNSQGIELFLRRAPTERFFGWVSYALSTSIRHNAPGETHVYDYDQPNIATVVAGYKLDPGWDLGLKWRYSSGLPTTPIVGSTYDPVYNRYLPSYGPINSDRLPDYHRLDLSTSLTTTYDTWEWKVTLEILNVYNHANVLAYDYNSDYSTYKSIFQLPFLPYLCFEAKY